MNFNTFLRKIYYHYQKIQLKYIGLIVNQSSQNNKPLTMIPFYTGRKHDNMIFLLHFNPCFNERILRKH